MAITTIADLFASGADFEAQQFLSGELTRFSSLEDALRFAYGSEYDVDPLVLRAFQDTVQAGMISAHEVRDGIDPQYSTAPLIGDDPTTDLLTIQGRIDMHDVGEGDIDAGITSELPFEAVVPILVTAEQLNELVESNLPDDLLDLFSRYPRMVDALKRNDYMRTKVGDKTYDIYVTSVYRGRR